MITREKLLNSLSSLCVLLSFTSCGPIITFNEAQPAETRSLSEFPSRLLGEYQSITDSSMLRIEKRAVIRFFDRHFNIHPNQLDSTFSLSGDSLVSANGEEGFAVKRIGDSLELNIHVTDTLFHIGTNHVLKKFKGYYFLNQRFDSISWTVRKLSLIQGRLSVSDISVDSEIDKLIEITESPVDTNGYHHFELSRKQLKTFVRMGGFSESEVFLRLEKRSK